MKAEDAYYIYMSVFENKSLYELVTAEKKIDPNKVRKWTKQLAEGVCVLQKYGIAHRFLKLKHLLLYKDNLLIVGWSKSVFFYDPAKGKALLQHKERRARKNNYLPPEAFKTLYDPSRADVWAIGVVIVSLTTHRYPFHVRAKCKFTTQWRQFVQKHPMNPIIRALCNKIFVVSPKKRIKCKQLLADD